MCLAQGQNKITQVRLKPTTPRFQNKQSTTEPLCSPWHRKTALIRLGKSIRNYQECEDGIEKIVMRTTACRVMSSDDREGKIFLSLPHTSWYNYLAYH